MAEALRLTNASFLRLDGKGARFAATKTTMAVLVGTGKDEQAAIRLGGGAKAAEAQRAKGRLTVRERLALLLDAGTELMELGLWAAHGMYEEYGGAPAAGVVTGLGRVSGRLCM